jgi:hypothetical protein
MAWQIGTALIPNLLELKSYLGPIKLEGLETDGSSLDGLLVASSDSVYRYVEAKAGIDPSKLTNFAAYKPAVASHVMAVLVRGQHLETPVGQAAPLDPIEWAAPQADRIDPKLSEGKNPPSTNMARPKVVNVNSGFFGKR